MFSTAFTLARKLNISPKKVFQKFGNPITVKYIVKDKLRQIQLYKPETLKRERTMQNIEIDPFWPPGARVVVGRKVHKTRRRGESQIF